MSHLPHLQEATWPLVKKFLRNCSRAQATLRQHNADQKQDTKALACLVFLFCLYNSKINQLVLVILKFYDKTYISSSNFLFHVCFSFFLSSSLFLLLRFLQDEVPGSSSSPAFRGGVVPRATQMSWAMVCTLQRALRAAQQPESGTAGARDESLGEVEMQ